MDLFDILTMIGGLCLFLFGMSVMGDSLERRAGDSLRTLLGKLTTERLMGFLTGLAVTTVIQSSSATTVMVVGFVNSGLMTLRQAINVIMGANVGTTVTAWLLSLMSIDSGNVFVQLLKPTSFTPVLALIGILCQMLGKTSKKKDTGMILLGFATLMIGMDIMSGAVNGLKDVPAFQQMFVMFKNPILGVLAGAVLTGIIQSSSASVGILQALAVTGQISVGAVIPIIMGQNIGTCITALLSCMGTTKNARRAALVHLSFNVIGTTICLVIYGIIKTVFAPVILDDAANAVTIAVCHSAFNILCTIILLPMSGLLEKLAHKLVPDAKTPEVVSELDERLLDVPAIALERCRTLAAEMGHCAVDALHTALDCLVKFDANAAQRVRESEDQTDHYEDILGSYLVKLSSHNPGDGESAEAAMLLKVIGDFERICDHGVNIIESAEELLEKGMEFSAAASKELSVLTGAVSEIIDLSLQSFLGETEPERIEPLEQVIDDLKEILRSNHIMRLQKGECTIDVGFVWSDLLTSLSRTSDHCSNIAGCMMDYRSRDLNTHQHVRRLKTDNEEFRRKFKEYSEKYAV